MVLIYRYIINVLFINVILIVIIFIGVLKFFIGINVSNKCWYIIGYYVDLVFVLF